MQRVADVCVVGGGVAGAATAFQLARRGVRVVLIDAAMSSLASTFVGVDLQVDAADAEADRRPEGRRLRVGEGQQLREVLPPAAVHALAALGADDVRTLGGTCRGVLSRWQGDEPGFTDYELFGCTPARAVSRGVVARCLVAHAVRAGAEVVTIGPTRVDRSRAGWSICSDRHPQVERLSCRHMIDATGRSGRSIAALPARCHHDRAVCLSTRHATPLDDPSLLIVDRSRHGWWFAIAAGASATDVAFVTDADLLPRASDRAAWLAGEYREAALVRANLEGSPQFLTLTSRDARSGHRATAAGDGWLAVGDAALSWDPLSGRGMQFALESADRAADAVVAGDAERRYPGYARWCDDAVAEYGRVRTAMYAAAATLRPEAGFWQRRSAFAAAQP